MFPPADPDPQIVPEIENLLGEPFLAEEDVSMIVNKIKRY